MAPWTAALERLRETVSTGRTLPAEFRRTQLQGLERFLNENRQLLQEALAEDLHKVGWAPILPDADPWAVSFLGTKGQQELEPGSPCLTSDPILATSTHSPTLNPTSPSSSCAGTRWLLP